MTKANQTPRTVLVVEDDPAIQLLAAQTLRSEGYHVLVASDSPDALRLSDEYHSTIDLVLTDIMLPSGNGIALASTLLLKRPDTRVLYMSGFNAEAIQAVQYEGGPNGEFLEKPFVPRALAERVRMLVPLNAQNLRRRPEAAAPSTPPPLEAAQVSSSDAEYRLESAVKCPQCGEAISTLKAVRLLRTHVNFTSTLPRRGRVITCPSCLTIVPAELTNF
jgi:DNA-binding response OmpR family regulator